MLPKIFIFFLLISFALSDDEEKKTEEVEEEKVPECPENMEWNECGMNCIPSCAKIFNNVAMNCTGECIKACFCSPGFLWDEMTKLCVRPKDCTKIVCKQHEEFKECGNNCGKICLSPEEGCEDLCQPGCFCEEGYMFKKKTNKCVIPQECYVDCKEDEEFKACGCPVTCDNYADPSALCTKKNCQPNCYCKPGLVLEPNSKNCIEPEDCPNPPICPKNSVFKEKGQDCKTCENFKRRKNCFVQMTPKCYCEPGLVRNYQNECVSTTKCPDLNCQHKDPNTIYTNCAVCLPSCQRQKNYLCPPECTEGCKCKEGFIKDEISGKCITMEQCNEILKKEASKLPAKNATTSSKPKKAAKKSEL